MTYLNCPLCGLSVVRRSEPDPAIAEHADETCPRCRGRLGAEIPMYATERPRPPVAVRDLRRDPEHSAA